MIKCEVNNGSIMMSALGTIEEVTADIGLIIRSLYDRMKKENDEDSAEEFKNSIIFALGKEDSICWLGEEELKKKHDDMLKDAVDKLDSLKDIIDEIHNGIKKAEEEDEE